MAEMRSGTMDRLYLDRISPGRVQSAKASEPLGLGRESQTGAAASEQCNAHWQLEFSPDGRELWSSQVFEAESVCGAAVIKMAIRSHHAENVVGEQ